MKKKPKVVTVKEHDPNEMRVLRRKNIDGEEVWMFDNTRHENFRNHRFLVRPKGIGPKPDKDEDWKILSNYLFLKSVRFFANKHLVLTFYMVEDNLDFLIKAKYPKKLTVALLSGFGSEQAWIEVSGVKLIENRADSLVLDYSKTDILTIDVLFKFQKAKLTKPHAKHYTGKEKHA